MQRLLLKYWCIFALVKLCVPAVYLLQAIPLCNFLELYLWTRLVAELCIGYYKLVKEGEKTNRGFKQITTYFVSGQGYMFGNVTRALVQLIEKWSLYKLEISTIDRTFGTIVKNCVALIHTVGDWLGLNVPEQQANWYNGFLGSFRWRSSERDKDSLVDLQDYDMLEDVIEELKDI